MYVKKTKIMVFNRKKRKIKRFGNGEINREFIEKVQTFKYVGFTFKVQTFNMQDLQLIEKAIITITLGN